MNYELAKQLKEAGFKWSRDDLFDDKVFDPLEEHYPTVSELIEACKKPFQLTVMPNGFTTACSLADEGLCNSSPTPEEAVV